MSKARELAELSRTVSDSADATAITINSSEEVTFADDIFLGDGKKVVLGAGSDLQIYHDGSNSYIEDAGTGALFLKSGYLAVSGANGHQIINAEQGGAVELYHANSRKLLTTSSGIDVTGSVTADGITSSGNISSTADIVLTKTGTNDAGIKFATAGANRYLASDENGVVAIGTGTTLMGGTQYLSIDSGNATFSGSVTSAALTVTTSTYNKINSYFSGSYISGFKFSDLNGGIWYDAGTDDLTVSAGHANSKLILVSGGSTALTLLSDQSATFSGSVTVKSGNKLIINRTDNATGGEITYGPSAGTGFTFNDANGDGIDFKTGSTLLMSIDSTNQRVAIGIPNPTEKFTVVNSSSGIVGRFTNNTNQTLDLGVISGSGAAGGVYYNSANSGYHAFQVGGSEKARISGGTLMVGTQDAAPAVSSSEVGVAISGASGYVAASRSNSASGFFNRLSNGDILSINKDGTLIGSIGSNGGTLYMSAPSSSGAAIVLNQNANIVYPGQNSSGTVSATNNAIDLGASAVRWKDLFLSNSIDVSKTTTGNLTSGNARAGAVLKLHHEAQWENGYTGGDFLGGIEFSSGDSSGGEGVRAAIKTSVESYYNTNKMRFYVAQSNSTNLLERLELADTLVFKGRSGTSPAVEMVNFDQEDNNTGRETTLRFKGHRSGGELITNAQISGHHSGDADDDKGMMIFWSNTGSGGLVEAMRIRADSAVALNQGSLIIPNGYGVHFGASAGSGASSTVLDDYEEGVWTPTLPSGGSLTAVAGTYTKIGRQVTVQFYVHHIAPTANNSGFQIGGLPYAGTSTSNVYHAGSIFYTGTSTGDATKYGMGVANGGSYIYFHFIDGSSGSAVSNNDWISNMGSGTGKHLIAAITYTAA